MRTKMGKNGELWDDSALIKAFDDAISKYKVMHAKGDPDGSLEEIRVTKGTKECSAIFIDESNGAKSAFVEADDNSSALLKNSTKTGESMNSSLTEEYPPQVLGQYASQSNGQQAQVTNNTYTGAQGSEDYNNLLNQYNAIEEQRQKILEQLYQFGNWDYQGYDYGYGEKGAVYASQEHREPASQASCPHTVCSCRTYLCPYSTAPCTSLPAVCCGTYVGKTCDSNSAMAHNGSSVSLEDDALIKSAMAAAEGAIRSFKTEASGLAESHKEEKRNIEVENGGGNISQDKTSQTDLTVVLNAWFSAGFYTGKYLAEQASAKK